MPRVVLAVIALALALYALSDCLQSPRSREALGPRWVWVVVILLLPIVGPLLWLLIGRTATVRRPEPPRALAPDDDPEFLRRLDEQIRRERRDRERGQDPDTPDDPHPRG
ncbi:PLDc_N domain-containing protein [Brachybacterium sp. EF45031]|uniref:PLD nuclease N-terminal domain-containing protein n=1 Tax=Brachybacterium sillae TaxID=2810536 RepID=UPI00217E7748|nr:PLD nuclease N-terminal domain-containing protein [Brachybacterium sillae]MCS6711308.1 PLDc_N domain-containing protein [Brachybacterium sillae]